MSLINYSTLRDLSQLDASELIEEPIIEDYRQLLLAAAADPTKVPTIESLVAGIISDRFYLPKLIIINNVLGMFVGGAFLAFDCNFSDGEKLVKDDKKAGDPDRFSLKLSTDFEGEELTIELSVLVPDKTKTLDFLQLACSLKGKPENVKAFAKVVIPEAITNLPDGVYQVKSISRAEKYAEISLTNGATVRTNSTTPDTITQLQSIAGFIYSVKRERLDQGISLTGKAENLLAVSSPAIGTTYQVLGVSSNDAGTGVYHTMALKGEGINGVFISEGAIVVKAVRNLAKNQPTFVSLVGVKEKTGKMTSDKPVWSVVKPAA